MPSNLAIVYDCLISLCRYLLEIKVVGIKWVLISFDWSIIGCGAGILYML